MIRINLLSEGRRPVVARKAKPKLGIGDQDPSVLILLGGLVLGLLVSGVMWYLLHAQTVELDGKIGRAKRELKELEPILREVEDFKAKKTELERKISVIRDLKRQQRGPVQIMDQISQALPDLLWLEQMSVTGTTVTLEGKAFNTNAVATFIGNLRQVPEFKEPVPRELTADRREDTFSFSVSFNFIIKPPEEEELNGDGAGLGDDELGDGSGDAL